MTTLVALAALVNAQKSFDADDIVQKSFKDATFTATILESNQAELKKINRDFAASQRFGTTKAFLKEPNMMKLTSTVDDTDVVMLLVGTKRTYIVPKIKLKKSEDLGNSPGKRQTTLDFGMITPAIFNNLFVAKFLRVDRESGNLVFDLTYQTPKYDDTSRQRVFVDKDKRYVTRRVWFNQEGQLLATFYYSKPKFENGVWFPTYCMVKNAEDKVAGVTEYQSMKINSGLPDSIFTP
ncbi:MAG: outer membrane lipoprotein-sorting protein [Fimbriimonadales bacterium]